MKFECILYHSGSVSDTRSLRSWYNKATNDPTLLTDSSAPLMQLDLNDSGSMTMIQITPKKCTHGRGSRKIWTGSMDPQFLLALKLVVINDYKWDLHLWYNFSCLLLNSLYLRTAENLQTKSFSPSETWTLLKSHHINKVPKLILFICIFLAVFNFFITWLTFSLVFQLLWPNVNKSAWWDFYAHTLFPLCSKIYFQSYSRTITYVTKTEKYWLSLKHFSYNNNKDGVKSITNVHFSTLHCRFWISVFTRS